jgi:CHAD domain-containing protein
MSHGGQPGEKPLAGAFVLAKLRTLDTALVNTAPRLLAKTPGMIDEEAVHDLRVAIRRTRTLLKMSRSVFGRWHTDVVREAFAEVMRATGELRDEEVLEETLAGAAAGPEYAEWLRQRSARESKLRRAVIARIERGDLDRARLLLKALLVFPVEPERNVELARFARRTVERARRRVERRRDVDVADVIAMHELRIAYKELRYSIELLAEALPIDARAQLEPAVVFQKRLGELHDVDVATDVVQKTKGLPPAAREQALAQLAALREKRVHKYLRELDPLRAGVTAAGDTTAASPPPAEPPNGPLGHGKELLGLEHPVASGSDSPKGPRREAAAEKSAETQGISRHGAPPERPSRAPAVQRETSK